MAPHGDDEDFEYEDDLAVDAEDPEVEEPGKFACILHNDDYSTMEFVLEVLERFFQKTHEQAMDIMLRVHNEGRGVAGIYSRDIAETKAHQVTQLARAKGFPLMCTVEEAS